MRDSLNSVLKFFTSLQVTVVLLVMSMVLVFVATIDQVNLGIWAVQEKYFRSLLVFYTVPGSQVSFPVFPGGYLVGGLLLLNLLAVHVWRFRFSWKRTGIILTHTGLIVLLVGELVTGILQQDYQLRFNQGESKSYAESFRDHELAVTEIGNPGFDEVVAIPESLLSPGKSIQVAKLPFRIQVKEYFPNSDLEMRDPAKDASGGAATAGLGTQVKATALPVTYRPDENNIPTAYVEITGPEGGLGTFLVSPRLEMPQFVNVAGRSFTLKMRLARVYFPFSLTLTELRHDVYPGSEIPRNFSSRVRLKSDDGKEDREVLIFMNNPLRHGGMTFYQYQMNEASHFSALQVVSNPGWFFPYLACLLLFGGMLLHFSIRLGSFISRRASSANPANS